MSKPMATTLPWRTKPPERIPIPGIETKSPVERPGFLFGAPSFLSSRRFDCPCCTSKNNTRYPLTLVATEPVPANHHRLTQQHPAFSKSRQKARLPSFIRELAGDSEGVTPCRYHDVDPRQICFPERRRLSLASVPAIRICGACLTANGRSSGSLPWNLVSLGAVRVGERPSLCTTQ